MSSINSSSVEVNTQDDPFIWLEDVDGDRSLEFVNTQNRLTIDILSSHEKYSSIYDKCLEEYNSKDKIAYPHIRKNYAFNFWKDENHVRGVWRRCLKDDYISGNPNWEILLDIDEMAEKDGKKWVFKGASSLYPDYNRYIINLSKGGGDATVKMEFDMDTKSFVENGFYIEEAKGGASYIDENTLLVGSDFGENSMTTSGYPRQVRIWNRGSDLEKAKIIFESDKTDIGASGRIMRDGDIKYIIVTNSITFYTRKYFCWQDEKLIELNLPIDSQALGILKNQLILDLKSDWLLNEKTFKQGSIVSLNFTDLLKGDLNVQIIVEPDEFKSVAGVSATKNKLLVNQLNNIISEFYIYSYIDGEWISQKLNAPDQGSIWLISTDEDTDQFFFAFTNFLTPTTLYLADAIDNNIRSLKSLPAYFDADKYEVKQLKAKSKDGTIIPYFQISSKTIKVDGNNPTLIYSYGGFEISLRPDYLGTVGASWLENGGVHVVANIRGGGEFGPKWHQAGLKEKRQNVYDDFYAVSEDLISNKITSPKNLGIMGGSNGGLLVGVAFTQRPNLFNAVVCQVPLLDMKRYHKLHAGASWMGEFGDPDKADEWDYIKKYSPYHNLKPGIEYPQVFFYTSTRDDRVHPGHARKMAAKMLDMGYPLYYYENIEGGHAGTSTNEQRAKSSAMTFSYLMMKLKN